MTEQNLSTSDISPIIKEKSALPHQENDIKPAEIVEITQEAPEEYIRPDRLIEMERHFRTNEILKEMQKEEALRLKKLRTSRIRLEAKLKNLEDLISDKNRS